MEATAIRYVPFPARRRLVDMLRTGLVEYRFQPDALEVRHVKAPGQIDIDLDELLEEKS